MIYYDTETCGLHGPIVLLQYAEDDGPVELWCPWKQTSRETIELIDWMMEDIVCGFNLAFDHFHLCQMYTTLLLMDDKDEILQNCIEEYAHKEKQARSGPCLKPLGAIDIMLHARKGPYQSTMDRSDIRIKRVPSALAGKLCAELDKRIPLKDVYFARKKDKKKRWQVQDIEDEFGEIIGDFKNIVLKFAPSSALKALAVDTGVADVDTRLLFHEVEVDPKYRPEEIGYAPYALAVAPEGDWHSKRAWPSVISIHITHWAFNRLARRYAEDDVKDTRGLYKYFGSPEPDDDDSILACMVGAVRWKGFRIDTDKIRALKVKAEESLASIKYNFNSAAVCRKYMEEVLSEDQKMITQGSTKATILEGIAKWKNGVVCEVCYGMDESCNNCVDGIVETDEPHPAALRAQEILDSRHCKKEIELYDKLLLADRFHASFKVIGTLSSRMAGGDGLNAQGIKHSKEVRDCFPLADPDYELNGGDFDSFEVGLMDAEYGDPKLREYLMSGKKIHAIFAMHLFGMTYEEVMATSKLAGDLNKYAKGKAGVFALAYGGEAHTLIDRVGVTEQRANEAYASWCREFKVWASERKKIFDMFCSMRQPHGIGSKVEWYEPADYIQSMFGFKRYFTLENQIVKALFQLAEDPPKDWTALKINVTRRDRVQSVAGACRSALFAAAFAVQASNMRAAGNHVIQSSGATITKSLQRKIWDLQPGGRASKWIVQPLNVHDEIMCPVDPKWSQKLADVVNNYVQSLVDRVPLIAMEWHKIANWGDK